MTRPNQTARIEHDAILEEIDGGFRVKLRRSNFVGIRLGETSGAVTPTVPSPEEAWLLARQMAEAFIPMDRGPFLAAIERA